MPFPLAIDSVDNAAHVIQDALTPVFLLSGIGTLLNVFNTRLARVSDHTQHAAELLHHEDNPAQQRLLGAHLRRLQTRRTMLDVSVICGACGAAASCGAAFVLFLGGVRDVAAASWLFVLFGVALVCTVGALVSFVADGVLAWHGLRRDGPLPSAKRAPS